MCIDPFSFVPGIICVPDIEAVLRVRERLDGALACGDGC